MPITVDTYTSYVPVEMSGVTRTLSLSGNLPLTFYGTPPNPTYGQLWPKGY